MELDNLKAAWQDLDHRMTALEATPLARPFPSTAHSGRLSLEPILEIVVSAVTLLVAGDFLATHWADALRAPAGVLPALVLYAFAIPTIWLSVRRLMMIAAIDPAASVLETARRVEALESLVVRGTQLALSVGFVVWLAFPLFLAQWLVGYDIVFRIAPSFLGANLLVGLALVAIGRWLVRRLNWDAPLRAMLVGHAITRLKHEVADRQRFEKEAQ